MNNKNSIPKKIFPVCVSLLLAMCLIYSSFSVYLVENSTQIESTITNLEQGYIHHADFVKNTLYSEVVDTEDDDTNHKKNYTLLFAKILKTYWLHYTSEIKNVESVQYAEHPTEKILEHKYIEYCSLKIPSII